MNFFRFNNSPKGKSAGKQMRRVSMKTGEVARKLRFDGTMTEGEILTWLREAGENEQYSNLTFDEIYFTNDLLSTTIQVYSEVSKRHRSYLDRLNIEFCRGPVDMIVTTALVLNGVKHLFVAGDGEVEGFVVKLAAALRINISLRSLWLLHPISFEDSKALGEALSINDAIDKLSLSGCKWDWDLLSTHKNDGDGDDSSESSDGDFRDASQYQSEDDEDETEAYIDFADSRIAERVLELPRALADGLRLNTSLRTIDLSSCGLPDEALSIALEALVAHPTLEALDVSKNRAGPLTVNALSEIIRHPQSNLTILDLSHQRKKIMNNSKSLLRRKKKSNNDNNDDDDSENYGNGRNEFGKQNSVALDLISLSQAMYNNDALQELKLSHNMLTDDVVIELVRNLKGNDTLRELDLQYNSITARGLAAITKGLSDLPSLEILLLGGNAFGKEGNTILAQLEDDDDSVCTILEPAGDRKRTEEDEGSFYSAKSSSTKNSSSPSKTSKATARGKLMSGGLMGGLTGISER